MSTEQYQPAVVCVRGGPTGRLVMGFGLLVGERSVVTCAHVVSDALHRNLRCQERPSNDEWILIEFCHLDGAPVRSATVVSWTPPPKTGASGGDVAGLQLTEDAPSAARPGRFSTSALPAGAALRVFGYPDEPRRPGGMWVDLDFKGINGRLLQVESRHDQTVKAQPGYSGSPAFNDETGEAVGLVQSAPFAAGPARDGYLISPQAIAEAWEEPFGYLLIPPNPYRGLEPFTADDRSVFFGRDTEIQELARRVTAQPVVIVVGPSGVGKSSLVQSGLLPALSDSKWSKVVIRPGLDPWLRLARGLLRVQHAAGSEPSPDDIRREVDRLHKDGLGEHFRMARSDNRELILVVDQFEELLTSGQTPDQELLDLLIPPPETADDAGRIVLTLRADFQSALQAIPGFAARLNERLYLLSPLAEDQIRDVVQKPAAARGVSFEDGLVDQIVQDAAGGSLPVLEFTLTQLWETQQRNTITFSGYHAMGGVRGALDQFAKQETAQLGDTAAEVLDHVLLRLVREVGAGSEIRFTRQRLFESEVSEPEWEVLNRLGDLVIIDTDPTGGGGPYAELAHESLIYSWQRLRVLIDEHREFLRWRKRVQDWMTTGDDLPEARIAEARDWIRKHPKDVPDDVRKFVADSQTKAEARIGELRRHAKPNSAAPPSFAASSWAPWSSQSSPSSLPSSRSLSGTRPNGSRTRLKWNLSVPASKPRARMRFSSSTTTDPAVTCRRSRKWLPPLRFRPQPAVLKWSKPRQSSLGPRN